MTQASVSGVIPMGGHFHRWRLGCKQSSLGHITRVLQRTATDAFGQPLLYRHVQGVDGVLIGLNDLSISLGHPGDSLHPDVDAAVAQLMSAATAADVPVLG